MSLKISVNQNDSVTIAESGGGGNPNYMETITGTLANPWGEYLPSELLGKEEVSVVLTAEVDGVEIVFMPVPVVNNQLYCFCGAFNARKAGGSTVLVQADSECVFYEPTGAFLSYGNLATPNDYNEYSDSETKLLIIHHPLPD